MENIITEIINKTISSFDFPFCISVNIATYLVIKVLSELKSNGKISTWNKRIIFVLISLFSAIIYYIQGVDITTLFNSIILAPVSWSWIFKPICDKFNVGYNSKRNV